MYSFKILRKYFDSNLSLIHKSYSKRSLKVKSSQVGEQDKRYSQVKYAHWEIVGSSTPSSSVSATLNISSLKYAFNCGEGFARLKGQDLGRSISSLKDIFVTRMSWDCIGDLPNLLQTLSARSISEIRIHGPPNLRHLVDKIRPLVDESFKINTSMCESGEWFEDESVKIRYISFEHSNSGQSPVIAYAGFIKPCLGSFSIKLCVDNNVSAGPFTRQLLCGADVTLENGTTVKASDVRVGSASVSHFMMMDIPSNDFLHHLENNEHLNEQREIFSKNDDGFIFHFSPPHILSTAEYQRFLNAYPKSTKHYVSNNSFSGYIHVHRQQRQMHEINDRVFPLLGETFDISSNSKTTVTADDDRNCKTKLNQKPLTKLSSHTKVHVRPIHIIESYLESLYKPNDWMNDHLQRDQFTEKLENLRDKLQIHYNQFPQNDRDKDFPKIVFLGTSSSQPIQLRNVAGILVHITKDSCILLDCGVDTAGQLYRFYGNKTKEILEKLKAIFISHYHTDHYIGLLNILRMRRNLDSKQMSRLTLMIPHEVEKWLQFYNNNVQFVRHDYKIITNDTLFGNVATNKFLATSLGLANIQTCFVSHIHFSFGISLTINQVEKTIPTEFKLTYSGDTTPCDTLLELGQNSTLLIHEATFEDGLEDSAKKKRHSTISQAVDQGRKMNAKYTVLTHFSARYSSLPRLIKDLPNNVGIAFDNMELVESDLAMLSEHYPVLKIMFQETIDELDAKACRRKYKELLNKSE